MSDNSFLVKKRILIASDHAGYNLKANLKSELSKYNLEIIDLGCDSADISVDYPDYVKKLADNFNDNTDIAILICGSGIGISIAANRYTNIRAALCFNEKMASLARKHNNTNVLCLGANFVSKEEAILMLKTFLTTKFEAGRHERRVNKL